MVTDISQETLDNVDYFKRRFEQLGYGEGHFIFACHGAFPIGLTTDLLYQLWANFKDYDDATGQNQSIDPLAVSDLILSGLCRPAGGEVYEMDVETRAYLLQQLRNDERFGEERMKLLGYFLYQYTAEVAVGRFPQSFIDAQQWTALASIAPEAAAGKISSALSKHIEAEDSGEIVRMRNLLESYSNQDERFESMLHYAKGLKAAIFEMPGEVVQEQFNKAKVLSISSGQEVGQGILKIPMLKTLRGKVHIEKRGQTTGADGVAERIRAMKASGSTELDLSRMKLVEIPPEVFKLTELSSLDLFVNEIHRVPEEIERLENLEHLLLSVNPIGELPVTLSRLNKLKQIKFDDGEFEEFPAILLQCQSLENISLENNEIEFCPPEIGQLPNLKLLDLRGNKVVNLPQGKLKGTGSYWRDYFDSLSPLKIDHQIALILGEARSAEASGLKSYHPLQEMENPDRLELRILESYHTLDLFRLGREYPNGMLILHLSTDDFWVERYEGEKIKIRPDTLVQLFGQQQQCRLFVLNFSDSINYSQAFLDAGYRAGIVVKGEVNSNQMAGFANDFYRNLVGGMSIRESLEAYRSFAGGVIDAPSNVAQQSYSTVESPEVNEDPSNFPFLTVALEDRFLDWKFAFDFEGLIEFKKAMNALIDANGFVELFERLDGALTDSPDLPEDYYALKGQWEELQQMQAQKYFDEIRYKELTGTFKQELRSFVAGLQATDVQLQDPDTSGDTRLNALKDQWRQALSSGLEQAFSVIEKDLPNATDAYYELLVIQSRFHSIASNIQQGSVFEEEIAVRENRIRIDLLSWIDGVDPSDLNAQNLQLTPIKEELLELVKEGKIGIHELAEALYPNSFRYNEFVLIFSHFQFLRREERSRGVLSPEQLEAEYNKIRYKVVQFIRNADDSELHPRDTVLLNLSDEDQIKLGVKSGIMEAEEEKAIGTIRRYLSPEDTRYADLDRLEKEFSQTYSEWQQGASDWPQTATRLEKLRRALLKLIDELPLEGTPQAAAESGAPPEDVEQLKANWLNLLEEDQLETCLDQIHQAIRSDTDAFYRFAFIETAFSELEQEMKAGIVDPKRAVEKRTQIRGQLANWVNELEGESYGLVANRPLGPVKSQLFEALVSGDPLFDKMHDVLDPASEKFNELITVEARSNFIYRDGLRLQMSEDLQEMYGNHLRTQRIDLLRNIPEAELSGSEKALAEADALFRSKYQLKRQLGSGEDEMLLIRKIMEILNQKSMYYSPFVDLERQSQQLQADFVKQRKKLEEVETEWLGIRMRLITYIDQLTLNDLNEETINQIQQGNTIGGALKVEVEFELVLTKVGEKKISVIKEIYNLIGLGLKESKELVESAPVVVKSGLSRAEAEDFRIRLERVGATVKLNKSGESPASESPTHTFEVMLQATGNNKIQVIKELRSLLGLGLKETKDLADHAPISLKKNVSKEEAEKMKSSLESAGATVNLIQTRNDNRL